MDPKRDPTFGSDALGVLTWGYSTGAGRCRATSFHSAAIAAASTMKTVGISRTPTRHGKPPRPPLATHEQFDGPGSWLESYFEVTDEAGWSCSSFRFSKRGDAERGIRASDPKVGPGFGKLRSAIKRRERCVPIHPSVRRSRQAPQRPDTGARGNSGHPAPGLGLEGLHERLRFPLFRKGLHHEGLLSLRGTPPSGGSRSRFVGKE